MIALLRMSTFNTCSSESIGQLFIHHVLGMMVFEGDPLGEPPLLAAHMTSMNNVYEWYRAYQQGNSFL
jgi:hypothetical protein